MNRGETDLIRIGSWNGEFCHETLATVDTSFCGPAVANSTGAAGVITAIPHASLGSIPVMVGDTWYSQAWYRDAVGGVTTSNLTDAVRTTYL